MTKRRMQKAQRRQARHSRVVAQRVEKKRAPAVRSEEDPDVEDLDLEEGDELEEVLPAEEADEAEDPTDEDEPEEVGPVRKDMGMEMASMYQPMGGPTSFDELDAQRLEQERAQAVRSTTWDVEDLVRNIMANPTLDTTTKSKAIQTLGKDFGARVSAIMASDMPDDVADGMSKSQDMDLLYTEALIASDARHLSAAERVSDWFSKAKLSYAAKQAKGDSAYALVYTDKGGNKVRKYLIHDKAHVRNALARAAQQIKGGGAGANDARRALPKIHAAAKRMGIGMGKSQDAILIEKDARGDWRWVGLATNNFIDWSGDIVRKSAHEEYVGYLDKNPDMAPMFMSWHTPGTERKNPVDFWAFENGFLILSGKLEEGEAAGLLKAQAETDLGMSINGLGLHPKDNPHDITMYRLVEVSDLPRENADNPFTAFSVLSKEVDMDKKEYLAKILGSPEKAAAFIEKTGIMKEQLEDAGVTSKEKTPATEPKPAATPAVVPAAAPADAQAIIAQVLKELDAEGLNEFVKNAQEAMEKVPVLEALVKDLQGNQDEELAKKITPPAQKWAWASKQRASEADETKIDKDDKLAQQIPALGENWLSVATGTKPIDVTAVH